MTQGARRPAGRKGSEVARYPRGRRATLNAGVVIGAAIVLIFILLAVVAPWVAPYRPDQGDLIERLRPPGIAHWLGTDALGRDVLSRLIYGTRVSLVVGLGSILAAALVGVPMGVAAGYFQGRLDALLMRISDVLLSVPKILIAILIMAIAGPGIGNVILAIGLWNVPVFARIARATTLSLRERDFVTAANALGGRSWRIMVRHVFPNTMNELVVIATLGIAGAIMTESGLSFLGLGVPPDVPSWGMIIAEGRPYLRRAPGITTFAGLCIMLAVLGFNLLGDGVRDMVNPQRPGAGRKGRR